MSSRGMRQGQVLGGRVSRGQEASRESSDPACSAPVHPLISPMRTQRVPHIQLRPLAPSCTHVVAQCGRPFAKRCLANQDVPRHLVRQPVGPVELQLLNVVQADDGGVDGQPGGGDAGGRGRPRDAGRPTPGGASGPSTGPPPRGARLPGVQGGRSERGRSQKKPHLGSSGESSAADASGATRRTGSRRAPHTGGSSAACSTAQPCQMVAPPSPVIQGRGGS
jgi:hypothetical protein